MTLSGNRYNKIVLHAALTSKLLSFTISELGSKSIETPFVTSNQAIFYRTRERERGSEHIKIKNKKTDNVIIIFKEKRIASRNVTCPQQLLEAN